MYAKKGTRRQIKAKRKDPYQAAAVRRILKAKNAPPDPRAPTDPDEFIKWLNSEDS